MKPSLQVRLSQHLALTPQLQQSIKLLQLSTLELQQEIEQMLDQNPFLETEDETGSAFESPSQNTASADRVAERDDTYSADADDAPTELRAEEFGTTANTEWENGTESDDFDGIRETPSAAGSQSGETFEGAGDGNERNTANVSLQDHLRAQLTGMRWADDDLAALHMLIESLDSDGYLADSLEDIAERVSEMFDMGTAQTGNGGTGVDVLDRLKLALRWLQQLEPLGVGARNLPECLMLQLRAMPRSNVRQLAIRVCEQHLELLARRDMRRLSALTGANEDLLRNAHALIVQCEPKPGRQFIDTTSSVVVPDIIVTRSGRGLKVIINPDVMPKLRINDFYASASRGSRGNPANPGLASRLQEARWFMKNIQQRFDTILRVSIAIVERQKSFFAHGAIAMKPLVLREIADELGLHESTISRVTTAKFMATPNGTFELKYFFGSSLNTEAGGVASSTAVRALIEQFIEAENTQKPLSDGQLADMLAEQGITVARRTVAKYREGLKIAPTALRRVR